jgi:hypothetical protein
MSTYNSIKREHYEVELVKSEVTPVNNSHIPYFIIATIKLTFKNISFNRECYMYFDKLSKVLRLAGVYRRIPESRFLDRLKYIDINDPCNEALDLYLYKFPPFDLISNYHINNSQQVKAKDGRGIEFAIELLWSIQETEESSMCWSEWIYLPVIESELEDIINKGYKLMSDRYCERYDLKKSEVENMTMVMDITIDDYKNSYGFKVDYRHDVFLVNKLAQLITDVNDDGKIISIIDLLKQMKVGADLDHLVYQLENHVDQFHFIDHSTLDTVGKDLVNWGYIDISRMPVKFRDCIDYNILGQKFIDSYGDNCKFTKAGFIFYDKPDKT